MPQFSKDAEPRPVGDLTDRIRKKQLDATRGMLAWVDHPAHPAVAGLDYISRQAERAVARGQEIPIGSGAKILKMEDHNSKKGSNTGNRA